MKYLRNCLFIVVTQDSNVDYTKSHLQINTKSFFLHLLLILLINCCYIIIKSPNICSRYRVYSPEHLLLHYHKVTQHFYKHL